MNDITIRAQVKDKIELEQIIEGLIIKTPNIELKFDVLLEGIVIGETMLKVLNYQKRISLECRLLNPDDKNYSKKGYGYKAMEATANFAFLAGIDRLVAFAYVENKYYPAVIKILSKLGFYLPHDFELLNEAGTISYYEKNNPHLKIETANVKL